jgi:hypothetical protein
MLSVTCEPYMLSVICEPYMLSVVMLSVVAPPGKVKPSICKFDHSTKKPISFLGPIL